jgi:multimeric flavodoxin WrbA
MKVLAINGSAHRKGTTAGSIGVVAEELEAAGIEVEVVEAGSERVRGCIGCFKCVATRRCVFDDDIVNATKERAEAADGLLLASPVYYAGISGNMKSFLDRLFFSGARMRFKTGASIVSLRRSGGMTAFQQLNAYLEISQMVVAPSQYWNIVHGSSAEEALGDLEGQQILRVVGRNMAWLMKAVAAGREAAPYPELPKRAWTNFIR